ncbi:hypothetical protein CONCODRAFT_8181 [Conidiobolus coronatus NRRL 28638]|uniref:Cytochrome b561 domain-containing protein n=1 Tax=Conidiobolus coronatus (strain ATCC 28846 / CBS 209.66 / NRRL 28638) TaxID=796925 RepID=A0A137P335_CONC2|nr:hypothetical protein CONCODRAFT_8181 [Conidiobolus coronatus NRRL 28638]|eukprot:KXN69388.1 hypothetical protein CONCODRAFT_8181 [Conidiobolus coronatus NRRL 28638]
MGTVNNKYSKIDYVITAEDEGVVEVLDTRVYKPIGKFKIFYYITQVLVHCLLIGILINIWTKPYAFSFWHPTFAIIGIYLYIQGTLQVQCTEHSKKRLKGAKIHTILNGLATVCIMISFIIIVISKNSSKRAHFTSVHGQFGLVIFIFIWIAAFAGTASLYIPGVFGGRPKAKRVYSPHRILGYLLVIFMLIETCLGVFTSYGLHNFKYHWVIVSCIIVLSISLILTLDIKKVRL